MPCRARVITIWLFLSDLFSRACRALFAPRTDGTYFTKRLTVRTQRASPRRVLTVCSARPTAPWRQRQPETWGDCKGRCAFWGVPPPVGFPQTMKKVHLPAEIARSNCRPAVTAVDIADPSRQARHGGLRQVFQCICNLGSCDRGGLGPAGPAGGDSRHDHRLSRSTAVGLLTFRRPSAKPSRFARTGPR